MTLITCVTWFLCLPCHRSLRRQQKMVALIIHSLQEAQSIFRTLNDWGQLVPIHCSSTLRGSALTPDHVAFWFHHVLPYRRSLHSSGSFSLISNVSMTSCLLQLVTSSVWGFYLFIYFWAVYKLVESNTWIKTIVTTIFWLVLNFSTVTLTTDWFSCMLLHFVLALKYLGQRDRCFFFWPAEGSRKFSLVSKIRTV